MAGATANGAPGGPVEGCDAISTWARNVVASAAPVTGGLRVSGLAQPLATGVSVSTTDGIHATAAVDADVATAAPAHIRGVALQADLAAPGGGSGAGSPGSRPGRPTKHARDRSKVAGLRARARITLRRARTGHLRASFTVPSGARYVRVRLLRHGAIG